MMWWNAWHDRVPGRIRQYLFILVLTGTAQSVAVVMAWPSVLPGVHIYNGPGGDLTQTDIRWLSSLFSLPTVLLPLLTSLGESLGPKRLLSGTLPVLVVTWLVMAVAQSKALLVTARVLQGITSGLALSLLPSLLSEVVSPEVRGRALLVVQCQLSLGLVLMYTAAALLPWRWATALCTIPAVVVFGLLFFLPESPYWLVKKGKDEEARAALSTLRGGGPESRVEEELKKIRSGLTAQPSYTAMDQLYQLSVSSNAKPLALVVAVWILLTLGGQFVVFVYAVFLLQDLGLGVSPWWCAVGLALVRLGSAALAGLLLIDRWGRRAVFLPSLVASASAFAALAWSLSFPTTAPAWVHGLLLLFFAAAYGFGVGSLPVVMMGELLPTAVRPLASSVCIAVLTLARFLSTLTFPAMSQALGERGTFLVMTAFFVVTAILVGLGVPETRDMTLVELQELFASSGSREAYRQISSQIKHHNHDPIDISDDVTPPPRRKGPPPTSGKNKTRM
ncbi:facilitated trehalose transporter Tret1-2 homolog [Oratosquilla oratoria]|uniref:facilitated trehalose transporter Tret1-2 homolog n=1 Tax=Oratosquilla oratoria TaxID=337810 RepID=UPI003F76F881